LADTLSANSSSKIARQLTDVTVEHITSLILSSQLTTCSQIKTTWNSLLEQTATKPNSSPLSFVNYLAHLNCPMAGDSNFTKINTLNSLKTSPYPYLSNGVVPRCFLGPFVVALMDLPPRAPTVINKIINDCIVLFLQHVQRLYHFSKIQLSTANLIRI
jgi:hypothetical protein